MVGAIAVLPLISAALLWLLRNRPARFHWAASVLLSILPVVGFVYLGFRLPLDFSLSNWQPADVFDAELQLRLYSGNWPIALAVAAMPLSLFLTSPVRPASSNSTTRILLLAYTGLANLGVLAANSVTTLMTWASADVLGFLIILMTAEDHEAVEGGYRRYMAHLASVLLILIGSIQHKNQAAWRQTQEVVWLLAVFFRVGLWPLHISMPSLPGIRRGLGVVLRLLPPAMGMAYLARVAVEPTFGRISGWFLLLAGVSVLVGGLRWAVSSDPISSRPFFVLTLAGLAVATVSGQEASPEALIGATVVTICLGTVISQFVIYESWHRYLLITIVILALGLPLSAGHLIFLGAPILIDLSIMGMIKIGIILLGVAMLSVGIARNLETKVQQWISGESFVRNSYIAGLFVPIAICIVGGIRLVAVPDFYSAVLFVTAAGLSLMAWLSWNRWQQPTRLAIQQAAERLGEGSELVLTQSGAAGLRAVSLFFRSVGSFFEGKAALLWVYVILMISALFLIEGGV